MSVQLLKAHPHAWGPGRVHQFDLHGDKTVCGIARARCPSDLVEGELGHITCVNCQHAIERRRPVRRTDPGPGSSFLRKMIP